MPKNKNEIMSADYEKTLDTIFKGSIKPGILCLRRSIKRPFSYTGL